MLTMCATLVGLQNIRHEHHKKRTTRVTVTGNSLGGKKAHGVFQADDTRAIRGLQGDQLLEYWQDLDLPIRTCEQR